jgi:phthiocerol/phenolphthiocerol synthesis type-I polyketide synthase C
MGRIAFRSGQAALLARATLLKHSSRSLQAEFALFAADGSTRLPSSRTCAFAAFASAAGAADRLRFLAYHGTPTPHPPGRRGARRASLSTSVRVGPHRSGQAGGAEGNAIDATPRKSILCSTACATASPGWPCNSSHPTGGSCRRRRCGACQDANPDTEPWLTHLLALAEEDQLLTGTADGWEICPICGISLRRRTSGTAW